MKLLGISLGSLVVVAMIWATLFFWGHGLNYQAYDHPLMNPQGTLLSLETNDPEAAQQFLKKYPESPVMLSLSVSQDGVFFTYKAGALDFIKELPKTKPAEYKGPKHYSYSYTDLKASSSHLISLDEWTQNVKPKFWIFNVEDNAQNVDKNLIAWIEKNNLQDKVIVTSPVDLVLTALKKEKPLWVIGSSLSDLNKLLTLASIHLESIANFKRDYYFTPVQFKNRDVLNPRVLDEVRKRFKKVAIGPVHTDLDREKALAYKPDILILSSSLTK